MRMHGGLPETRCRSLLAATRALSYATHLPWAYSFSLLRLACIFAAYLALHRWLRTWLKEEGSVLGVLFVAASPCGGTRPSAGKVLKLCPSIDFSCFYWCFLRVARTNVARPPINNAVEAGSGTAWVWPETSVEKSVL